MFFRKNRQADKRPDGQARTPGTAVATKPQGRTGLPVPTGGRKGGPAILGSELLINGDVTTDGHLLIDGRVHGTVEAQMVTLAAGAEIHGRIEAEEAVLHGMIRGEVRARRVHLVRGCRVFADIHQDVLQIDEGAYLEGGIKRLSGADLPDDEDVLVLGPQHLQR